MFETPEWFDSPEAEEGRRQAELDAARAHRQAEPSLPGAPARRKVRDLLWSGVALIVLAMLFAVLAGTTGLGLVAVVGLGAAGQMLCLVSVIAWGVRFGIESARPEPGPPTAP